MESNLIRITELNAYTKYKFSVIGNNYEADTGLLGRDVKTCTWTPAIPSSLPKLHLPRRYNHPKYKKFAVAQLKSTP